MPWAARGRADRFILYLIKAGLLPVRFFKKVITMTALRQQMENDMVLRGMAVRTRQSYIEAVRGLTKFYRWSPDGIAVGEVQSYLLHLLQERGLSHSTCNLVTNRTGRSPAFMRYRMNPCASLLQRRLPKPPQAALRLCPPLTLPRARTILHEQPDSRIHRGNLSHDRRAEPIGTASRPRPAPYDPQGS
jgi:hypothetical protein